MFLSFFKRTCILSVSQPKRLLFLNWFSFFVSLKEVDAALLCVTKAKPGPTFFRELGDKGNEILSVPRNTSCFLSHQTV